VRRRLEARPLFLARDELQVFRDQVGQNAMKIKTLAAAQNGWQTFCGSVVAKMNFTCGGGSSSVFRRALKAAR
jgi:hypothetical protein